MVEVEKNKVKKKSSSKTTKKVTKKIMKKKPVEVSADELFDKIKTKKKKSNKTLDTSKTIEELEREFELENSAELLLEEVKEERKEQPVEQELPKKKKQLKNEDLIITREIRFDDKVNFKNKKVLMELKYAIESYDKLDDKEVKNDLIDDTSLELFPAVRYSHYKLKRNLIISGIVLMTIFLIILIIKCL